MSKPSVYNWKVRRANAARIRAPNGRGFHEVHNVPDQYVT